MRRPYPLVTAHSGCLGSALNSRAHVERAVAAGVDALEFDMRLSRDGRVVLSHDARLPEARSGEAGTLLREADWPELQAQAREAGWELLSLEDGLDLLPPDGPLLNLDAKEVEAALAAAAVLEGRGWTDRAIYSGLEEGEARLVRKKNPGLRCLLNADRLLPAAGYGLAEIRRAAQAATEAGACGLNLDWRAASPDLMAYARARSLPVFLWTVDEVADMARALALSPYCITTNWPDRLMALL